MELSNFQKSVLIHMYEARRITNVTLGSSGGQPKNIIYSRRAIEGILDIAWATFHTNKMKDMESAGLVKRHKHSRFGDGWSLTHYGISVMARRYGNALKHTWHVPAFEDEQGNELGLSNV